MIDEVLAHELVAQRVGKFLSRNERQRPPSFNSSIALTKVVVYGLG